jgi:transposase, IS6 family
VPRHPHTRLSAQAAFFTDDYLYRAIDKHGNPVDFLLTAKRDLEAAKRFFRKALKDQPLLAPDRIGTDGAESYPPAIAEGFT